MQCSNSSLSGVLDAATCQQHGMHELLKQLALSDVYKAATYHS